MVAGTALASAGRDTFYVVSSLSLILFCFAGFLPRYAVVTPAQRPVLWFALAVWISGGVLLGWLSIGYDFGIGGSPLREYPFFTAGRLLLGGLIPFLLVYASGLNFLVRHATCPLGASGGFDRHRSVHAAADRRLPLQIVHRTFGTVSLLPAR